MRLRQYLVLLFVTISTATHAQSVSGTITDGGTNTPLIQADITNLNTNQVAHTNAIGDYTLFARPGDTLVYIAPGYKPVRRIKSPAATSTVNITMNPLSYELDDYTFKFNSLTKYKADSTERAETYKVPLRRTAPNPLGSPASAIAEAFSKKAKETYHFQKVFEATELQKFIDTRYTPELVALVTKLTGDSVAYFMYAYPMQYDYARTAGDLEIKMWIRENYKAWMKK